MKRSDESDHWIVEEVSGIGVPSYKSNHWVVEEVSGIGVPSYKGKCFYTAWVACALLLLVHLVIIGCGPLTNDQQSNLPFEDSGADSRPEKVWPVERTLVSNEVNCIAAGPDNVWIATARGVSRWDRQQDKWLPLYDGRWAGETIW